ncbi:metalloprotease TIKI1 isoform X5 [Hyaena hyaena]|uniref:metalloprotease TIKI1 isoform X5 n=1 Tax=Hyaena hyaena TaxID=95912 RepID=UPI0019249C42|nr:metalloprotease TIKI1 isoform X5 [Hyaena hyaena]
MSPWGWLLLPTLCVLRAGAAPPRGAPASANCELKPQQSELNSFLWTIKRDPPSYFFGTIHVPYTRVWDFIPDNSKEAFQQSSIVYFELDLTDPYTVSALTSCQMLPQGENLQDVLPRDIYCRLKRHLEYVKLMMPSWMTPDQRGKGLYADYLFNAIAGNWERKRPVWVMLMVNSLTEVDIKSRGVPVLDLYLAQEAERLRKQTGAVEKVEEQCHPLNGLNFSQVIFALNQTLLQQESLRAGSLQIPYTTEDLIKHYNCGDLSSVIFSHDSSQAEVPNFINTTLPPQERITAQEIDSYFRQELIYKRNERMGKRVKALLEEFPDKGFFFAFGAERRVKVPRPDPPPLPSLLRKCPLRKRGYRKLGPRCARCGLPTCPRPAVPTWESQRRGSFGKNGGGSGHTESSGSGSSAICGSDWRRALRSHSSRAPFWIGTSLPSCSSLAMGIPTTARWWPAVPVCLSGRLCSGCWCWLSKQRHPSCSDWRSQARPLTPWT